jgi:hypothetical protein
MQFVQSIWLWAITGIAVPIVIHLWNVKQGKTFKVGSILFVTETARSYATSLKISELLLLLLRCLLLMVLALLLCQPFITTQDHATKEKGWVLIPKQSTAAAYARYHSAIDSLLNAGYRFHYFNKSFDEALLSDTANSVNNSSAETTINYWVLLQQLNQRIPASLPVYLFTDNHLDHFSGSRPTVSLNIQWRTYSLKNSFIAADSNKLPPEPLTVFIYTDEPGNADAGYVKAALDALRDINKLNIKVTLVTNTVNITGKYDWLFWLSEKTIPLSLLKNRVFAYTPGRPQYIHSPILFNKLNASADDDALQVFKIIPAESDTSIIPLWKTGYGNVLLGYTKQNDSIYYFNSRFNPQWNDMPWSKQFPQIVYHLLYPEKNNNGIGDGRLIDEQQVQPEVIADATALPKKALLQKTDLTAFLWILAFILLVAERWIAYRKKGGTAYA